MALEIGVDTIMIFGDGLTFDYGSATNTEAPKAILCISADAGNAIDTNKDGHSMCVGGTDGATQSLAVIDMDDETSSAVASREFRTGAIVARKPSPSGYGKFQQFLSNGFRMLVDYEGSGDFLQQPAMCMMFGGDQTIAAEHGTFSMSGRSGAFNVPLNNGSMTPNLVFFWTTGDAIDSGAQADCRLSFGHAMVPVGGGLKQFGWTYQQLDGTAEGDPRARFGFDRVCGRHTDWHISVSGFNTGSIDLTQSGAASSGDVAYLALELDKVFLDQIQHDQPDDVDDGQVYQVRGVGFKPTNLLGYHTNLRLTDYDQDIDGPRAGGIGFGMTGAIEANEHCLMTCNESGSSFTDARTVSRSYYLQILRDDIFLLGAFHLSLPGGGYVDDGFDLEADAINTLQRPWDFTSLAIAIAPDPSIGLAAETDTALPVVAAREIPIGLASETDTAFPMSVFFKRTRDVAAGSNLLQLPAGTPRQTTITNGPSNKVDLT